MTRIIGPGKERKDVLGFRTQSVSASVANIYIYIYMVVIIGINMHQYMGFCDLSQGIHRIQHAESPEIPFSTGEHWVFNDFNPALM